MHVLYAAPFSKWNIKSIDSAETKAVKRVSTGALEKILIARFAHEASCVNRTEAGGDCPSDGRPHCPYVVRK
eukprot:8060085-Karenia_brevis.AAC.1